MVNPEGCMLVATLPTLLTEAEAAHSLGIAEITLRRMRKAGKVSYITIGKKPRYTAGLLNQYLESHTCPALPSPTNSPSSPAKGPDVGISSGGRVVKKSGALRALKTLKTQGKSPGR